MQFLSLASFLFVASIAVNVVVGVHYEVKPLKLGVEVTGINLQDHMNDSALFDQIRRDTHKHRLMVFRDQGQLPTDAFYKIFHGFGQVVTGPFTHQSKDYLKHPKAPAIAVFRISNDVVEGMKGTGTGGWHMDGSFKEIPYLFLAFNAVKAPLMGDTKFVGHREVLAALPREQVEYLDRLSLVNDRVAMDETTAMIHPLIYNHPVVNESVMLFNIGFLAGAIYDYGNPDTQSVLSNTEVLKLKATITRACNADNGRLVYSHNWKDGDLVILDNQQLSHLPSKESQMPREKVGLRILHRIAIAGIERPTKKRSYFEQ